MNKSLRFLAIGLALAVLLVSQVGVDRTAEAVAISGNNDTVEFAGPAGSDNAGEQQDFYRPEVKVDFYLKDPDLALPTANRTARVTWTVPGGGNFKVKGENGFLLMVPPKDLDGKPSGAPAPAIIPDDGKTGGATTTAEGKFGAGQVDDGSGKKDGKAGKAKKGITYTANDNWKKYMGDGTTPLDGTPTVTVTMAKLDNQNGNRLVTGSNPLTGRIAILGGVEGKDATYAKGTDGKDLYDSVLTATTTIEVTFKYHVADVFTVNKTAGTTAGADQNRAKVTSSSDGVGEWVELTEVVAIGSTSTNATSNIYHGSIYLEPDSSKASKNDGEIGVRDGDTLTVAFYEDDHVTVVDEDTATIDGENPAILSISPGDGTVTDRSSPVVTVTVSDAGSGIDTSFPRRHVDISIVDRNLTCRLYDTALTATRLSSSELDILFRNTGSWVSGGVGLNCDMGLGKDFIGEAGTVAVHHVDATSLFPGDNNHGIQFVIRVVARDVAGNESMKEAKLTIDTSAPSLEDGSTTGKNWDAAKDKETDDRSAIKVVFNEALDVSTVDASDFVVENPDASIESVQVGGVGDVENEIVYLTLSGELASDARPRVELDGSILDKAGNELKSASITRIEDGVAPGVTVDAFSAQLLAAKAESAVTFSADENMAANTAAVKDDECTCLGITGGIGNGTETERGPVNLATPSNGSYTFKAGTVSGIYGILVQASDIRAKVTREGATKVTDEKVTAADVTPSTATTTSDTHWVSTYTVTVGLAKWPLADAGFTGSLASAVTIKGPDSTEVTGVDWENGKVTLKVEYDDTKDETLITDGMELLATYSYVKAEQTIEVDVDKPVVEEFTPSGDTQRSRPFIRIKWDETEYAGDTHTTVTVTSATLTHPDDSETVLVGENVNLLSTSDSKLYSYLPTSDLALGEYTIMAVGRDAAGNVSEAQSGTFKVVARPAVSISLNLGWNLVSLPAEPADSAIDTVINVAEVSQVLTYDPTVEGGWLAAVRVNGAFEGGLTNIDATKSYLVYTTSVDPLKVDIPGLAQGAQDFPPAIQLHTGWNMVPASSLNPDTDLPRDVDSYLSGVKWTRGYYYDEDGRLVGFIPGETDDDELVVKGRGFLIYVTEDSTLVP